MSKVRKVAIFDEYDGFRIHIYFEDGRQRESFHFDQEDTRENLKKVFELIGVKEVTYEEVY